MNHFPSPYRRYITNIGRCLDQYWIHGYEKDGEFQGPRKIVLDTTKINVSLTSLFELVAITSSYFFFFLLRYSVTGVHWLLLIFYPLQLLKKKEIWICIFIHKHFLLKNEDIYTKPFCDVHFMTFHLSLPCNVFMTLC